MGSFGGHILPGFCFILFGGYMPYEVVKGLFSKSKSGNYMSIIIICLSAIGILLELFWPVHNEPPFGRLTITVNGTSQFYKPMNWQHTSMYLYFLFFGFARILSARLLLAQGIDRIAATVAFGVEGYLFYNHVHGRSPLDTKIHLLITLICWLTAAVWLVTFFLNEKRKIFIFDIISSILIFAQGTWFWHVAFILYGSNPWVGSPENPSESADSDHDHDDDDEHHHEHEKMHHGDEMMSEEHVNTMFAVLFFSWHIAFAIVFILSQSFCLYKVLEKRGKLRKDIFPESNLNKEGSPTSSSFSSYTPLQNDMSPLLNAEDDDDENVMFEK